MLQASSRQYVCWQCVTRSSRQYGLNSGAALAPRITQSQKAFASTQTPRTSEHSRPPPSRKPKVLPIRDRLRNWAQQNADLLKQIDIGDLPDHEVFGKGANIVSRPQSTVSSSIENIITGSEGMSGTAGETRLDTLDMEVGVDSRQPGDLVEMRPPGSRTPLFAVYLGFYTGRHHFYASQGRWIMSLGFGSMFTVSNFASLAEIQPIIDELPKRSTAEELRLAQQDDLGPSRATASALIEKMTAFKTASRTVYLENMNSLDRARQLISDPDRVKYLSLFEIASILLPSYRKKQDPISPAALYAVHTALYRDEIAFRPLSPTSDCHRRDHIFEVFPQSFSHIINNISAMVRNYWVSVDQLSTTKRKQQSLERTAFGSFIEKARKVVLSNRERRAWQNGGITPSNEPTMVPEVQWSQASWEILTFLQWWASFNLFESHSRFGAYGAAILRNLNLYPESALDQSTAWTFLQEAGVISYWEVPSRYRVRFPETGIVKGGGLARSVLPNIAESTRLDIAAEYRAELPEQTVFCIDGPGAVLIDDGISLERTEKDDEFWIHVHAADPSSAIQPRSDLSRYMELIPENIYLPGHFQAMLSDPAGGAPRGEVQDLIQRFSLAPGTPALTFSAKVNHSGDILDYKVRPTSVKNVVYMDPEDVATFCNEPRLSSQETQELSVGQPPESETSFSDRTMVKASELDQQQQGDISILYRLAEALKEKRLAKGAWPYFVPGPSINVGFHPNTLKDGESKTEGTPGWRPADPSITVETGQDSTCSVVGNLMVLAGQVAARWCSDRKIPVPYRKDTKSADNYDAALKYATEVVYPQLKEGHEADMAQRAQLSVMTGAVQISTTPGPHFMMGIDMYAKATSPLRRFSDLLVHWQVHAALAHEHQIGRAINPEVDKLDEILPFPEAELADTLSLLHMREKMARTVSRGDKDWMLMALSRAWRFEGTLPSKIRFTVSSLWKQGLMGTIDLFNLHATMLKLDIENKVLIRNIQAGDQFDVEITDVDTFSGSITVRALEYFPKAAKESAGQIAAAA